MPLREVQGGGSGPNPQQLKRAESLGFQGFQLRLLQYAVFMALPAAEGEGSGRSASSPGRPGLGLLLHQNNVLPEAAHRAPGIYRSSSRPNRPNSLRRPGTTSERTWPLSRSTSMSSTYPNRLPSRRPITSFQRSSAIRVSMEHAPFLWLSYGYAGEELSYTKKRPSASINALGRGFAYFTGPC